MRQEQQSTNGARRYTHDAWGRLVKVESVNTSTQVVTPISTHRFNGLHWRIAKAWHAVADAQNKPDRKTTFWYDAAWRVIQENQVDQVNEGWGGGTLQEAVIHQFWGVRYIDDAVARMRLTGDGAGNVQSASPEDLAFQLTDAQFSVMAVATPGKPSVVIDRIAYTPYGESTRTLRSDVNGDGVVNKDDYDGVIQPLKGTVIGDPAYVVEADLDRDGKITSDDYDVCIADDGQKSSGGVGEAGLFSAGVRNSVGYCGYIHNEDTGLYTVRYRTYSAVLGRWLTKDPIGYPDGMNSFEYVASQPLSMLDPDGLDGCDIKQDMWLRARGVLPPRNTPAPTPPPPPTAPRRRIDWVDEAIQFGTGLCDMLSFGLSCKARQDFFPDLENYVDRESTSYQCGEWASILVPTPNSGVSRCSRLAKVGCDEARNLLVALWRRAAAPSSSRACGKACGWLTRGAEADVLWRKLGPIDRLMWELGLTTLTKESWELALKRGYTPFDIAWGLLRGELKASPGQLGRNLGSGPTPAFRWLLEKLGCFAVRDAAQPREQQPSPPPQPPPSKPAPRPSQRWNPRE